MGGERRRLRWAGLTPPPFHVSLTTHHPAAIGGQQAMDLSRVEHLDGQGQVFLEGRAICPVRYDIDRVGVDASGKPILEGIAVVPSKERFNPQVLGVLGSGVVFVLRLSTGDEIKVKLVENLPPPPTGRYKITIAP
jgi:hypothetical protein